MDKEAFKFSGQDAVYYDQYMGPIIFEPYGKYLASRIDASGVNTVLEIAGGTGRVTKHIRAALPKSVELIMSDLSNDMLNVAKQRLKNDKIAFRVEDAQNLSFPNNSFDLIICEFGMMFLPDRQKGFNEICRVLKPGGKLMCFTWDSTLHIPLFKLLINELIVPNFADEDTTRFFTPFSMFNTHELKAHLVAAGFREISVENIKLTSGPSTAENTADAFLLKHRLGRELDVKNPSLRGQVGKRFITELKSQYGSGDITFDLSAFLSIGYK